MRRRALLETDSLHPYTRRILKKARQESFTLPSKPTIRAIDKMVRSMVSSGYWDRCDIFYLGAYNDTNVADFSMINWISPDLYMFTHLTNITYQNRGWKFSGIGAINTNFMPLSQGVKITQNNAHQAALVYDVFDVTNVSDSLIAGSSTNGVDRWSAFNTNIQRINANTNIDSPANMVGANFKSINRKSATDVVLTNGDVILNRAGDSRPLSSLPHLIGVNSTTTQSKLGISSFSMGAAIDDLIPQIRQIFNDYLYEVGLPANA